MCKNPFIEPCIPTVAKEPPGCGSFVHEVKFDGYRCQIYKDGEAVTLYSRNGNDFTERYRAIATAALSIPMKSVVLDCELTVCNDTGTPDFSALLRRKHDALCIWVFDILAHNGKDLRRLPLWQRREKLDKLMQRIKSPIVRYSELFDDPLKLLHACSERGMEGVVSKRRDRPYQSGRSRDWIKVKCPNWRDENRWRHEFFDRRK